ncbi:glycosyltransferase [Sinomonas atrocyanea]|uniref:glycosyltransferase n=1 Tax=Sinomonas atrocyanea TaxID=37927 RepID=UPI00353018B6
MGRPLRARAPPAPEAGGLTLEALRVTAVVVAHDGGPYLPATLAGLAGQTRPVDAAIGIDTGSRDHSAELLCEALGAENVTAVRTPGGFGGAVARGLGGLAAGSPAAAGAAAEWLWLLHDDAAPAPDALAGLLAAVEAAPSVAVAGCKQLDPDAPGCLVDVGLSVSRWGERLTLIDVDEQDQGQYDARSDVFAVNSAGMLVRRDVWESLRGFDPALPATGDDVDFCWRARLAGHRVVVVPGARMMHSARPGAAGTPFAARRAEVYSRLKHAPLWQLPLHAAGALLGGLWQFLLAIVLKEPGLGAARLGATLAALGMPARLARGRRAARRSRTVSRSVLRPLISPRRDIWAHRRALLESAAAEPESVVGDGSGMAEGSSEPTGDSQDDFAALAVASRGWVGTGALVVAAGALLAAFAAFAPLLGAEAAVGGALVPVSTTLSAVFAHATSWWAGIGPGQAGHGDPFDLVLWILGLLAAGDPNRGVTAALVAAAPVAGLGAWALAANLTAHRAPRWLAALVWAAAPSLLTALAQGRLGAAVAHAALPWAVLGMVRAVGGARIRGTVGPRHEPRNGTGGVPSWTAAAAGGLALAAATAGAPSLVPLAAAVVLLASLALRGRARSLWIVLVPTAALFAPLWVSAPSNLRAWIADPGVPLAGAPAAPWQLVLGQPVAFDAGAALTGVPALPAGVPWSLLGALLVGAPVLAAAVAGAVLLTGRRGVAARLLFAVGVLGLAYAWAVSRTPTAVAGDSLAAPFAGPSLGAASMAFITVGVLALDRLLERRRSAALRPQPEGSTASSAPRRAVAAAIVLAYVLVAVGPAGALAQWAATALGHAPSSGGLGAEALVGPGLSRVLPATAADLGQGTQQTRTLVLHGTDAGGFTANLMRGAGTTLDSLSAVAASSRVQGAWGSERIADDDAALTALRHAVATVGGGAAVDPRSDLEQLGIGFVVLADDGATDEVTAGRIDAVPFLVAVGRTDAGWLWRVTPRTAGNDGAFAIDQRARIVAASGATLAVVPSGPETVSADIPAGPQGRKLVLAERSDAHWSASLDGTPLAASAQGWAQAFDLPARGGHLDLAYRDPAAWPLGAAAVAAFALTLLLAIPARVRRTGRRGAGSALLVRESLGRHPQRAAGRPAAGRRRGEDGAAAPAPVHDGEDAPLDDGPDDWPIDEPEAQPTEAARAEDREPASSEEAAHDDARL